MSTVESKRGAGVVEARRRLREGNRRRMARQRSRRRAFPCGRPHGRTRTKGSASGTNASCGRRRSWRRAARAGRRARSPRLFCGRTCATSKGRSGASTPAVLGVAGGAAVGHVAVDAFLGCDAPGHGLVAGQTASRGDLFASLVALLAVLQTLERGVRASRADRARRARPADPTARPLASTANRRARRKILALIGAPPRTIRACSRSRAPRRRGRSRITNIR